MGDEGIVVKRGLATTVIGYTKELSRVVVSTEKLQNVKPCLRDHG